MSITRLSCHVALSPLFALLLGCSNSPSAGADAGPTPDLGVPRPPLGMPITAPAGAWTWVDFPDSECDDGSHTGIGINPSPSGSKNLIFFINGGGACWDYQTCVVMNSSTHGPFGSAQLTSEVNNLGSSILARVQVNPVGDYNFVIVPYCTGDIHVGDNIATYSGGGKTVQIHHKGRANMTAFLARVAATFPNPDKLVVSGSSAGGYGTALNYDLFRQYFPQLQGKSYMLDDSGPLLKGDAINPSLRTSWYQSWNLDATLGPLCPACRNDFSAMESIIAAKYPSDRLALISYTQDNVISAYFGISLQTFKTDLYDMAATVLDPQPNFRYYFVSATGHTFLGSPGPTTSLGVGLVSWIGQLVNDDPKWASVKP